RRGARTGASATGAASYHISGCQEMLLRSIRHPIYSVANCHCAVTDGLRWTSSTALEEPEGRAYHVSCIPSCRAQAEAWRDRTRNRYGIEPSVDRRSRNRPSQATQAGAQGRDRKAARADTTLTNLRSGL